MPQNSRISPNWSKSKKLRKRLNLTEKSRCSSKQPWESQKEFWDEAPTEQAQSGKIWGKRVFSRKRILFGKIRNDSGWLARGGCGAKAPTLDARLEGWYLIRATLGNLLDTSVRLFPSVLGIAYWAYWPFRGPRIDDLASAQLQKRICSGVKKIKIKFWLFNRENWSHGRPWQDWV